MINSYFDIFQVGGSVRDEILGIPCKDLDFVMMANSFEEMEREILRLGGEIFVSKPEFLTIRCKLPELGVVDFALPRGESNYTDGRHPGKTWIAENIEDDLRRRDFTMNAMAKNIKTGKIVDPFFGINSIAHKEVRFVGEAIDRLKEDALRAFRLVRFSICLNFQIKWQDYNQTHFFCLNDNNFSGVSTERIYEELKKMFDSIKELEDFNDINNYLSDLNLYKLIFKRGISFYPTIKKS